MKIHGGRKRRRRERKTGRRRPYLRYRDFDVFADVSGRRWFGTNLGEKSTQIGSKRSIDGDLVGRYLQAGEIKQTALSQTLDTDDFSQTAPPPSKRKRQQAGFGNFEGW